MLKPPPIYTTNLVLHPEQDLDYIHFEQAEEHPFENRPVGIPRVNAWWLAEAALVSYRDPGPASSLFETAGLQSQYVTAAGTDCYVAWTDTFVVVAFRGTEPDSWQDVLADARLTQVPSPTGTGLVHAGFAAALELVWAPLTAALAPLLRGRTLWFCGHSLGAALATLAAMRHPATHAVCTFGCPRVGDHAFAAAFTGRLAGRSLRYVNHHDIVTHVPAPVQPPFLYKHVDARRVIARDGSVSSAAPSFDHFFEDLFGKPASLLPVIEGMRADASWNAPTFLLDHMPKAYAIWLWNDYAQHG